MKEPKTPSLAILVWNSEQGNKNCRHWELHLQNWRGRFLH